MFLKDSTKKGLKNNKSTVIEIFKPVLIFPMKWRSFKVFFVKLHKRPLLTANIVKSADSGLTQFLAPKSS